MPPPSVIGFFGKIPSRGDFVTRGLSSGLVDAWGSWMAPALGASRALLGAQWDDAWMVAPVWRFALPAGLCGSAPVLGLMRPSADRVGRLYPLMLAAELDGLVGTPDPESGASFLDAAEDAGRDALADLLEPDDLWARLQAVAPPRSSEVTGRALWWTGDGGMVVLDGMPPMPDHAAMLAGDSSPGGAC